MSSHLSEAVLTALVDGELSTEDLASAKAHIDGCLSCANRTVSEWLLRSAVAKSGQTYRVPADFQGRINDLIASETKVNGGPRFNAHPASTSRTFAWPAVAMWTAACLIFALGIFGIIQIREHRSDAPQTERAAIASEVTDLHVAALAATQPQVLSSDRHTVKPWFQGKLPFSFNIPEGLPDGITLEGANFAYLRGEPVAQLIFNIGRHRGSVFIGQANGIEPRPHFVASHAGFNVDSLDANGLEIIAVSDADPSRLELLATTVKNAQLQP